MKLFIIIWKRRKSNGTIEATNGKEKDRRVWARAICLLHDVKTADVAPVIHGEWESIINAYRELEGWICKCCGTETKQK